MLVSWKWLSKYVDLPMSCQELELRLALAGLNHEQTSAIHGDTVIDLEVTSNRGDCLGHIGVAREIGVLYGLPLTIPQPSLSSGSKSVESLLKVKKSIHRRVPSIYSACDSRGQSGTESRVAGRSTAKRVLETQKGWDLGAIPECQQCR